MDWSAGLSPLHIAAYNADLAEVRGLLSAGADPDARDSQDCTPLFWSCVRGLVGDQIPVATALLDAGANANLVPSRSVDTALTAAIESGNVGLVTLLLERGASPNLVTAQGVSPLMAAAREGSLDMVRSLLSRGAARDVRCEAHSAADYARHYGHASVASLIDGWTEAGA